jgi:hypothetical protein
MESHVFVNSQAASSFPSNNYVYKFDTPLRGVYEAELLSATFLRTSPLHNVVIDIEELKNDRLVSTSGVARSFAVIPVINSNINSNVLFTCQTYYPIKVKTCNPQDLDRLTVRWKDQTGNIIPVGDNSLLIKFNHLK